MRRSKIVDIVIKAVEDKKGEDISFYDVRNKNPYYDYVIICTALNERNGQAIVASIEESFILNKHKLNHIEGRDSSRWTIVDGGNIIIHIFSRQERSRINLEELLSK